MTPALQRGDLVRYTRSFLRQLGEGRQNRYTHEFFYHGPMTRRVGEVLEYNAPFAVVLWGDSPEPEPINAAALLRCVRGLWVADPEPSPGNKIFSRRSSGAGG